MTTPSSTERLALCIPARNAAGHLPRLLESVRAQTRAFDEVWLYDDASDDETGRMARDFGARVLRSDVNTGPSPGKNALAALTTCEWVHFHDADEALYPEFVERARPWMGRNDVDVLLFATEDRDDRTGAKLSECHWDDAALRADAIRYCILNNVTNCGVYRRSSFLAAGGFDPDDNTKYNEDQAMHLRLALAGLPFRADAYIGTIVYRRTNSMSSGHQIECARAQYHVLQMVADRVGARYAQPLGAELWRLAGVCGMYRDWGYVRNCLQLASRLGYANPSEETPLFRALASVHPFGAVVAREQFVRWFKPELRAGVPSA